MTMPLRDAALSLLTENTAGRYTKPSGGQYPHQWNWDSALIAIGLSHVNLDRALEEMRSLLDAQWDDGMVPHIVFHRPELPYFPDAKFWQTEGRHQPGFASSGITQPPVLATCLRRISESHDVSDFVREVFPKLVKWHVWFHTVRDVDGSALAATVHPWESGTDDSPRWLKVMESINPGEVPPYQRVDRNHVHADERPTDKEYERFIHLVDLQRRNGWNQKETLATTPFCVKDILLNAILLRGDEDLLWLGEQIGQTDEQLRSLMDTARASYAEQFWDETSGLFYDFDVRANKPITVNTAATFLSMWAGLATPQQAERLVAHLTDPEEYWFEPGEGFLVTTAARNEPEWSPIRYWRGPAWVLVNWFVEGGLTRYGYTQLAERVHQDTMELLDKGGFVEYFNAFTGEPCGARAFSWSAALAVDMLDK